MIDYGKFGTCVTGIQNGVRLVGYDAYPLSAIIEGAHELKNESKERRITF